MKINKIVMAILILAGLFVLIYIPFRQEKFQSSLIEIDKSLKIDINVTNAYNERGSYILNNKYYLSSSLILQNNTEKLNIKDNAIWRPEGYKNIPRLSDIEAPFRIIKEKNNNAIKLLRGNDTIILKLDKVIE